MNYPLALKDGTILADDYCINGILGAGGSGITYIAKELSLDREIAIKEYFPSDVAIRQGAFEVSPKTQSDEEDYSWGLDRFIEEAQILAKFDHTNIVKVFRYFKAHNTAYMVLKFEEGMNLKTWLSGLDRFPTQTELEVILSPLLDALELIHADDFLHRDIAPDNIIIRNNGSPVLIDFGSARRIFANKPKTLSALIKPGYSPYEQYGASGKKQGPWTDIYSLGATLYHAVSGERPLDSPTRMIDDELKPAIEVAQSHFRTNFLQAIDHAIQLKIEDRPQSISAWREELFSIANVSLDTNVKSKSDTKTRVSLSYIGFKKNNAKVYFNSFTKTIYRQFIRFLASYARPEKNKDIQEAGSLVERLGTIKKPLEEKSLETQLKERQNELELEKKKLKEKKRKKKEKARKKDFELLEDDVPKQNSFVPKLVTMRLKRKSLNVEPGPTTQARRKIQGKQAVPDAKDQKPRGRLSNLSANFVQLVIILATIFAMGYFINLENGYQSGDSSDASSIILRSHNAPVSEIAFISDGNKIVSASADKTLKVWDSFSGKLLNTLYGHYDQITSLDRFGKYIVSSDRTGSVILWDMKQEKQIKRVETKASSVNSVHFARGSKQIIISDAGSIKFWDYNKNKKLRYTIKANKPSILHVAYSPKRHIIASADTDKTLRLWRARNGALIRVYKKQNEKINSLALSEDSNLIVTGHNNDIKIWSARVKRRIKTITAHNGRVIALAFSPDGQWLASAGADQEIKIWNWRSGELHQTFSGHTSIVNALAFSKDSRRLASASKDRTIRLWNIIDIKEPRVSSRNFNLNK